MAPSFDTPEAELAHYRGLAKTLEEDLEDTKLALEEFRASAGELEKELEKELALAEKQLKASQGREDGLRADVDVWKNKYQTGLREHTKTMTHMQSELDGLRKSSEEYRKRLRDMELDNDELEGKERMVSSSLQDVETKYGKAIERITLLEEELIEKSKLEEECQRLRDDLREMTEEVGVLRAQATLRPLEVVSPAPPADINPPLVDSLTPPPPSPSRLPRSPSRSRAASPDRVPPLKPLGDELTPRKRLVSTSAVSSPAKPPILPRSTSGNSAVFGSGSQLTSKLPRPPSSLFAESPLRSASPGTTRIPTPTGASDLGASRMARSNHRRDLSAYAGGSSPAPAASHIATLRAETRRMRGVTHRLVSSRNLREFSAIPVPKSVSGSGPSLGSGTSSATATGKANPTLGKSVLGRSVSRRAAPPPDEGRTTPRRSLVASPAPALERPPSRVAKASASSADALAPPPPVSARSPTPTSSMFRSRTGAGSKAAPAQSQPNYSRPTSAQAGRLRVAGVNGVRPDSATDAGGGRRKSLGPPGTGGERRFGFGFGFGGTSRVQSGGDEHDVGSAR